MRNGYLPHGQGQLHHHALAIADFRRTWNRLWRLQKVVAAQPGDYDVVLCYHIGIAHDRFIAAARRAGAFLVNSKAG